MIRESEIRQKLIEHLSDRLSLDDFEDWLVAHSWNMHQDSAPSAQDLASALELALYEYSSGHLTEAELRSELMSLSGNIVVAVELTMTGAEHVRLSYLSSSPAFQRFGGGNLVPA